MGAAPKPPAPPNPALAGVTGSAAAGGVGNVVGTEAEEQAQVRAWQGEQRYLAPHDQTNPNYWLANHGGNKGARQLAEQEAHAYGLKGALRRLFVLERAEGWLGTQSAAAGEGGLLSVLTLGVLHGERVGIGQNPQTGRQTSTSKPGSAEAAEGAASTAAHAVGEAASSALSWGDALGKFLSKLLEPAFWARILKVVAGGVGLLIGVYLMTRAIAPGAAPSVGAAAVGAPGALLKAGKAARGTPRGRSLEDDELAAARRQRAARERESAKPRAKVKRRRRR